MTPSESKETRVGKCVCGHAKRNHLKGVGLCLVKSCKDPFCPIYRPTKSS